MIPLIWQPWIDTKDKTIFIPSLSDFDTPDRKNEKWTPLYDVIDKKYDTKTKTLKKGTILYHGSLSKKFDFNMSAPGKYFGLDYAISSWILTESYKKSVNGVCKPPYNWKGYVHVFKLKKPLKYTYTKEEGVPFYDIKECQMGTPCIHPQAIIHESFTSDLWDLGTELTIPSTYNLNDYLEHIEIHEIDIVMMYLHMRHTYKGKSASIFDSWNPENAIRKVYTLTNLR